MYESNLYSKKINKDYRELRRNLDENKERLRIAEREKASAWEKEKNTDQEMTRESEELFEFINDLTKCL